MNIEICLADFHNEKHAQDVLFLLSHYALDPMGGGESLSRYVQDNLIEKMRDSAIVFSILCYVDGKPAGLMNCIEGFSTFACKPVINLHDCVVLKEFRGLNLSVKMMNKLEEVAIEKGACKLTLEVLEGNKVAQNAYLKSGFAGYELDPEMGKAMFWQKKL